MDPTDPAAPVPLLVVAAVDREAEAARAAAAIAGPTAAVRVVTGGVGRVNAAVATVRAVLEAPGPAPAAVISAGVAGALPSLDPLTIGDAVVASGSVYVEEGIETPEGFSDVAAMGFPLVPGADGNRLPAHPGLASAAIGAAPEARLGVVATVATCSGTDARAAAVRRRTGAVAEAMEGAAVLHAAALLGLPAIELRTISNTTGDRDRQSWDLDLALRRLETLLAAVVPALPAAVR